MHVFEITEEGGEKVYYAARSKDEAQAQHVKDWQPVIVSVRQLTDAELDNELVSELDEDERPTGINHTFRQLLQQETAGDDCDPIELCATD